MTEVESGNDGVENGNDGVEVEIVWIKSENGNVRAESEMDGMDSGNVRAISGSETVGARTVKPALRPLITNH